MMISRYPSDTRKFIIYACPVGKLNRFLETYLAKSCQLCGENTAHKYMPHCTLTGFFNADFQSVTLYIEALNQTYIEAKYQNLSLDIEIIKLTFNEKWHGLELQANGLKQLIRNFTLLTNYSNRLEQLRLKDWLHLSLAYDFDPEDSNKLQNLATEIIDLKADVSWELRFYQKNMDWSWNCLKSWVLC
ncbi:hypothetical protein [Pleurocapsa sp. PCC 7319]|uniref:hypothetical protein n=1 Tax=Pleurocapsa sp. PCC 7319 TaxID=118161 RepID=UPI0003488EC7|nr:hypothetical protein [Pleurocapsa sp. PCC 7319]